MAGRATTHPLHEILRNHLLWQLKAKPQQRSTSFKSRPNSLSGKPNIINNNLQHKTPEPWTMICRVKYWQKKLLFEHFLKILLVKQYSGDSFGIHNAFGRPLFVLLYHCRILSAQNYLCELLLHQYLYCTICIILLSYFTFCKILLVSSEPAGVRAPWWHSLLTSQFPPQLVGALFERGFSEMV